MEYNSKEHRYENLSPEEYLDIIRTCLRDLNNEHKPIDESNDNDESNDDDDDDDDDDDNDSDRAEWKIQLTLQNNCVSTKYFENTRTIYTKSEPIEIIMGSDTNDVINRLFDTTLKRFQQAIKASIEGSKFTHESVRLFLSLSKNRH